MVKLDLYSGLLGTGKTTLIKKMLQTAYAGYRVAVIENEIGEINLDAEEFAEHSLCVKEVTAGCLCCTVKGSFQEAVRLLVKQENPDYIIVEPTGAADIRGVVEACEKIAGVKLNRCIMVVNAKKIQVLLKVAGEFFYDQIRTARTIYLNFAEKIDLQQVQNIKEDLRKVNPAVGIVDTSMEKISRDTFGEGECPDHKWETAENRKKIVVRDARKTVKMLPGAKNVKELLTWTIHFSEAFSSEKIGLLLELLRNTNHCKLWRVKGYLPMADGSVRKVDVVYDEVFQEDRRTVSEEKIGILVLIGTRLDIQWLQKELNQSQAKD